MKKPAAAICFSVVVLSVSVVANSSLAETSAEALKRQIQERSTKMKEFRALLNDPDQTVRLASLDVMLKSDDIAMREMAFGMCFNSADQAMLAICLKNKFADFQTLTLNIVEKSGWSDTEKKALADWGGVYSFDVTNYDEKSGQFTSAGSYKIGKGQITGIQVKFTQPYCNGTFKLIDGGILEGEIGCTGSWAGKFPAQIKLQ